MGGPEKLNITENGEISASTSGAGKGGNIDISAPETIDITGNGKISVKTTGAGDAGEISIETPNLTTDKIEITASTEAEGTGGAITAKTDTLTLDNNSQLTVEANSSGDAGDINIET